MGARNYYFLVAGLPDLTIDQGKLQFGSVEFREYLKEQLHPKDYALIEWLFLPRDNQNLLRLLNKEDFNWDNSAIFTRDEIETAFTEEPLPLKKYIHQFIKSYKSETRLMPEMTPENELTTLYYTEAFENNNKFFKQWLSFELDLKNVLIYASAQKYNMPYEHELMGTSILANALRHKTGRDTGEASEWPYFERAMQIGDNGDIASREKAIDQLRWSFLDELNTFNYFSIEVIISYMVKLMIVERWLKLDPKTGEELFRRLLGNLQSSYEFPNEFNVNDGKK